MKRVIAMKKVILTVDDSNEIRGIVKYYLENDGYEVLEAINAFQTFKAVSNSKKIDLILLDVMLPGTDGHEIARKLKEDKNTQKIPIIMLTSKGDKNDVVEGVVAGADDYIVKPFKKDTLLERVKRILVKFEEQGNERS